MDQNLIVQKIHNEFDTAQDRILKECDKILSSLNIPTDILNHSSYNKTYLVKIL